MTRSRDIADQQENLGGAVAPWVGGKNYLINGNFDIFQRQSFASQTANGYSLDRWFGAVGGTVTITQQSTGAPVGSQYYMRTAYNGGGGNYVNQHNNLESAMVQMLVGRTVTFSVLIRANASYVATSGQGLQIAIDKNSTANTASGGTWSTIVSTNVVAANIPTGTGASDWYKVTITGAVPNDGTAAGLRARVGELVVGPSGAYWEMAQAQLEIGSVATPFSRAGSSIGGELALCQRYYFRLSGTNIIPYTAYARDTTGAFISVPFPSVMRVAPTAVDYSALELNLPGTANYSISAVALNGAADNATTLTLTASGLTQWRPYLFKTSSLGYLGFSAEL